MLELDPYLELLAHKPGALARALPLAQVRDAGGWPDVDDRWWAAMSERHDQAQGTREWLEVLMVHRTYPTDEVRAGVQQALALGLTDAGSVAPLVRRARTGGDEFVELDTHLGTVARYGQARAPSLAHYDALYQTATVSP